MSSFQRMIRFFTCVGLILTSFLLIVTEAWAVQFENCPSQGAILFGTNAKQSRKSTTDGYSASLGGVAIMGDMNITSFAKVGLAISGATARTQLGDSVLDPAALQPPPSDAFASSTNHSVRMTDVMPAAYGRIYYGWFFLTGSGGVGKSRFSTTRTLTDSTHQDVIVKGSYGAMHSFMKARFGAAIPLGVLEVTPFLMLEYVRLKKAFNVERDSLGVTQNVAAGGRLEGQQQAFGLQFAEISEPNLFYPELHLITFSDKKDQTFQSVSRLVDGIPSYIFEGVTNKPTGLNIGGSITTSIFDKTMFVTASYDYETRKGFFSHAAYLRVRYFF